MIRAAMLQAMAAADGAAAADVPSLSRPALLVLAVGLVLVLLGLLFLVRQSLSWIINTLCVLLGALLLIAAVFGLPLGLFDRLIDEPLGEERRPMIGP